MKREFLIAILLFSLLFPSKQFAQQYENFYTIKDSINNGYDSLLQVLGPDSMQGTGYYPNQRWIDFWEPLVFPSGDFQVEHTKQQQYISDYISGYYPDNSTSFNLNWEIIGPTQMPEGSSAHLKGMGQIHYIAFDPNDPTYQKVFACSPIGGLWKSTDGGANWVNAGTDKGLPLCGVSSIAIDPNNSDSWYISTGDGEALNRGGWQKTVGVYHSSDAGITWSLMGLENENYMRKIVFVRYQNIMHLFVATTTGIYEWDDGDTSPSFNQLIAGDFYDIEIDPVNPGIVYASGCGLNASVHKIDWINNTYTELPNIATIDPHEARRLIIDISPAAPNYLFIVATYNLDPLTSATAYLYRYDLSSSTLLPKGILPQAALGEPGVGPERAMGWAVSPVLNASGDLVMVFGNTAPISQSNNLLDNNPCTWTDVTSSNPNSPYSTCKIHVDMHHMIFTPNGQELWVGNDGGVYKSEMPDLINNWEEKNTGLAVAAVYYSAVSPIDEDIALSGQWDDGTIFYNRGGLNTWSQKHVVGGDGFQCHFDWNNVNNMWASYQYTVRRSTDGGLNFTPTSGANLHFNAFYVQNKVLSNILYGSNSSGVRRSTDFGLTWNNYANYPGVTNVNRQRKVHQ
jgi:hypothetical protein